MNAISATAGNNVGSMGSGGEIDGDANALFEMATAMPPSLRDGIDSMAKGSAADPTADAFVGMATAMPSVVRGGLDILAKGASAMNSIGKALLKTEPKAPPAASSGTAGLPTPTELPKVDDFEKLQRGEKPDWMSPEEFARTELQRKVQEHNLMITLMSDLMKMHFETLKQIVRNIAA